MASVSPAEGARGTSPRSAGGAPVELPPPPPRAGSYPPYWPCALCLKFRGARERTAVGLNKVTLTKYKRGKVVSKKASVTGQRADKNSQALTQIVTTARELNKVALSLKKTSSPKPLRIG